ncbi:MULTISPECIES: hypoxanthine phosphoribosyltransferase [Pelosinus]|uniref:Hypoxanthine phosphoribosyltransferase n=1 Tax=Pelosinus fermentans B4 TaxID=1149862 RepID=I9LGL5_9FIRM|nr:MULTISPECIES: hypoxanthine phosphoribosyltransferase [Pelosinus]EIW19644.1 hypoxanthine phosphoribosyltransferase [Pelosinus fermentans B4]EIW24613.1 hypoxanthine phosphoribosyltransferase [Pelosinus fermentans A11]OAM95922.1 hypoxanthine phosphoribosyltransferase [Pelosinus fermentans DSM 17108]SDR34389.1 hypoxanthine phosphoribosyltransferase [Pelosinus fermentans]
MINDVERVLLSEEQLATRIVELGAEITADYAGEEILMIGVLRGAVVFMADLARAIKIPVAIDFMAVSSYGAGTSSSGVVRILKDLDENVEGKHVLVVEDIIDSGLTLNYLVDNLKSRQPASIKICTLLNKPDRRKVDVDIAYNGFTIPDYFVIGYGLDYAEKYRNLPFIGILKPEIYQD